MTARSGGRYTVSKGGTPTLVERTGYKPEAEAKPAAPKNTSKPSGESKAAPSKEQTDESTDQ